MVRWNLRMDYNHTSVCRFGSCSISSGYILFFKGQIACPELDSGESRMDYNHPSVCRSRHARFHLVII
jgi:hypothetical protein